MSLTLSVSTPGFLAERLAKAAAVPAEQRGADVRAVIETCALQTELAEELGLPEVVSPTVIMERWSRWSAAPALKLARSHLLSPGGNTLLHSPQLHTFATYFLYLRTSYGRTGTLPIDLGPELAELLERDPSLETLAVLAAGLPCVHKDRGWERGESEHAMASLLSFASRCKTRLSAPCAQGS